MQEISSHGETVCPCARVLKEREREREREGGIKKSREHFWFVPDKLFWFVSKIKRGPWTPRSRQCVQRDSAKGSPALISHNRQGCCSCRGRVSHVRLQIWWVDDYLWESDSWALRWGYCHVGHAAVFNCCCADADWVWLAPLSRLESVYICMYVCFLRVCVDVYAYMNPNLKFETNI